MCIALLGLAIKGSIHEVEISTFEIYNGEACLVPSPPAKSATEKKGKECVQSVLR